MKYYKVIKLILFLKFNKLKVKILKIKILKEDNEREEYNRKGPMVLKTNLKNVKITDKLRNWKSQNVSELINQPREQITNFPNFTISSFKDTIKKNILTNSLINKTLIRSQDPNRTQAGMNILLNMRNRPQGNNNKFLDLTTIGMPMENKPRHNAFFEEEEMKILLKENYSNYTLKIKNLYPSFKFNHYYTSRNEQIENYYMKYGEEGDINNRNFVYRSKMGNNKDFQQDDEKYVVSNLLDILGVQENISKSPNEFRIKKDFLSRNDIVEISMIQNDLSFKIGIINKELDSILEYHGNKIYNYTEKNIALKSLIEEYLKNVKHKQLAKKQIYQKYIGNSTQLIIKGWRKNQINKFLTYLYGLEEIRKEIKLLDIILLSDDYYKIREIINKISDIKAKIKTYKENFTKKARFQLFKNIENKIKIYY
jgi:hypothetical protein